MASERFFMAVCVCLTIGLLTGCAKPWQSPEDMIGYQRRHFAHLTAIYPKGKARADVLDDTRGRHKTMIELPLDDEARYIYGGTEIGFDLPIMIDTTWEITGVEPSLVDVLEFFGGPSGSAIEAHYIFYDADDRVLAALGSPWD